MLTLEQFQAMQAALDSDPRRFTVFTARTSYDESHLNVDLVNVQEAYQKIGNRAFTMELGEVFHLDDRCAVVRTLDYIPEPEVVPQAKGKRK